MACQSPELAIPRQGTIVNSGRPLSGCRGCFPLSAATTTGLRPGVALRPRRRLPVFALGDGAGPLRATCRLLPHSHYGVGDRWR